MSDICPCCGSTIEGAQAPVESLEFVPLPKMPRRIVAELVKAYPAGLSYSTLANRIYWDDPNGGPDSPSNCIAVTIGRIKPKLAALGWQVGCRGGKGGIRLWQSDDLSTGKVSFPDIAQYTHRNPGKIKEKAA